MQAVAICADLDHHVFNHEHTDSASQRPCETHTGSTCAEWSARGPGTGAEQRSSVYLAPGIERIAPRAARGRRQRLRGRARELIKIGHGADAPGGDHRDSKRSLTRASSSRSGPVIVPIPAPPRCRWSRRTPASAHSSARSTWSSEWCSQPERRPSVPASSATTGGPPQRRGEPLRARPARQRPRPDDDAPPPRRGASSCVGRAI